MQVCLSNLSQQGTPKDIFGSFHLDAANMARFTLKVFGWNSLEIKILSHKSNC